MAALSLNCHLDLVGRGAQKGGSKKRKNSNTRPGSATPTPTTPPPPLVQAPAVVAPAAPIVVAAAEQPAVTVAAPTRSKAEVDSVGDLTTAAVKMETADVKVLFNAFIT